MPNSRPPAVVLFVGTRKGLFRVRCDHPGDDWQIDGPHLEGYEVIHTCQPAENPDIVYAAAAHPVWGAHIYRSIDAGDSWDALPGVPHHADSADGLKAVWFLDASPDGETLYAGIDPPGLFVSNDAGDTWHGVESLNSHETRSTWEPSKGIFAVHSICRDPSDSNRMLVAVSAGGVYLTEDGGVSWRPANKGVRAENKPEPYPESGHNVHRLVMHRGKPVRLYRQCYNGTYRSDDGGANWLEITAGLPSDFGYAIAIDPNDPETVFQIPETSAQMRTTVDGKLRVYRSRNGGVDWESASEGLPQSHVYVTVLREAIDTDDGTPCGVYFGTSGGQLFASRDGADSWDLVAAYLPKILTVKVASIPQERSDR